MPKPLHHRAHRAFTLIEILVVVSIIAVLAALLLAGMQRVRNSAAEARSVSALKTITQASLNFAAENDGIIPVLRWAGDSAFKKMPVQHQGWVSGSFWGCTQPYLFPDIDLKRSQQGELGDAIRARLPKLFGVGAGTFAKRQTKPTMQGSPFEGVSVPGDGSGLANPIAFNNEIAAWGGVPKSLPAELKALPTLQIVDKLAGTIYAAYRWGTFAAADGAAYVPMLTDGSRPTVKINYLPSKRAIASFLDGRVDYVTPPMDPKMFTIDDL